MRFLAIDYETANSNPASICCVGYALFKGQDLIDYGSYYCRPTPFEFEEWNMTKNGITSRMVQSLPIYGIAHEKIMEMDFDFMVAHNSEFDMNCMFEARKLLGINIPEHNYLCTMLIASQILGNRFVGLSGLAKMLGIELHHHVAESDAIACGKIFNHMYNLGNWDNVHDFIKHLGVGFGKISNDELTPCTAYRKKRKNQSYPPQIRDIEVIPRVSIPSQLGEKVFVFSGDMSCMGRIEAALELMRRGAVPADNVTRKTDYVVIGNNCYNEYLNGQYTGKISKALELREKGQNIQLIGESEFLRLLGVGSR